LNGLNTIPVSNTISETHALKIKKFDFIMIEMGIASDILQWHIE